MQHFYYKVIFEMLMKINDSCPENVLWNEKNGDIMYFLRISKTYRINNEF